MSLPLKRIVILGSAGSGKTVSARRLGERTGLPVICLDSIWGRRLKVDDLPAFRALIRAAHEGDEWISDGNFARATFDIRLPRAELVVWLERPRLSCTWRVIRRTFRAGESHKIRNLPDVLRFIWNFNRVNRPLIESARLAHGPHVPVMHMTSTREIEYFISSMRR